MSESSSDTSAVSKFAETVRGVSVSEIVERVHSGASTVHCKVLNLGGQCIGDEGVSALCGVLNRFTALEGLYLERNVITRVGVSALCNVLSLCEKLRRLYLNRNSIDDNGAKLIAETLPNSKLERLSVDDNSIGRDGIRALLLSAANSTTLTALHIDGNSGVLAAVADIVEILPHCRILRTLVLGWKEKELSEEIRERIRSAMPQCSTQLTVHFEEWRDGTLLEWIHDTATFHREFLSAMQRHGSIRVYRSRVSLVGDSRVGKTWTAKSLRGEPNYHPHTTEQLGSERTAAAESTALYVGDIAVGEVDLQTQNQSNGGPDNGVNDREMRSAGDVVSESGAPSVEVSSTIVDGVRRPPTGCPAANRRRTEVCKVNDRIRSFRFPEAVRNEYDIDVENSVCYLTMWDFGGQLMYHSWYQFFFAPGMIPCVVFDLSKLLAAVIGDSGGDSDGNTPRVEAMVNRIVHYAQQSLHFGGPDCRVLLVGTKAEAAARLLLAQENGGESAVDNTTVVPSGSAGSGNSSPSSEISTDTDSTGDDASNISEDGMDSESAELSPTPTAAHRAQAAAKAFELINGASPLSLQSRYYEFHYVPDNLNEVSAVDDSDETTGHLCAVENDRSMTDIGIKTLWNSLVGECVRARTLEDADVGRDTHPSGTPGPSRVLNASGDNVNNVQSARELLRNNMLPCHWYAFEKDLRKDTVLNLRNWCSVHHLWKYAEEYHQEISSVFEFLAMLSSMASAGDVVLTSTIPWRDMEESHAVPEAFMKSLVIIRPQRLIEVGRTLLPRPHETYENFQSRLITSLPNIPDLAVLVDRLWKRGIVGSKLLSAVLSGTTDMSQRQLNAIIELFEHRQILCRIDTGAAGMERGQWFVPSMVVFHAEHPSDGIGTEVKERRDSHIKLSVSFNWVPPGFPLLVVGALLKDLSTEPQFSLCHESGRIQFSLTYRGNGRRVHIDLPGGAAGSEIVLWTPLTLKEKSRPVVQRFLGRLLEAVSTACQRLRVEPLLEAPADTMERGLLLDVTVPVLPAVESGGSSPLHSVRLLELCRDDPEFPDSCDSDGTREMYRHALAGVTCMPVCEDLLLGLEE